MKFNQHFTCSHVLNYCLAISLLFLVISSWTHQGFIVQARELSIRNVSGQIASEKKTYVVAQIGSRPPRCERRCSSCGHCEAIQVPTNPQVKNGQSNSSSISTIAYARGDDASNYKPMSWKCKCGNLIFNP